MSQTTINIRMSKELKAQFSDFCENVGMNMTTAICMFAKNTVKNQALPFAVTTKKSKKDPFWSEANQKLLRESIAEMEKTGGKVHEVWMSKK